MTRRTKAFLNHESRPKKAKKEPKLETADDFQAAGVDFEDAAGKWRAGDAVKSMRFFQRAVEAYEQGLQRFPSSFDLAYNKARVQLEIATHPVLVKQLQQPPLAVLQVALESHRYALKLDPGNADTLFNASQVLTGIAEEIAKDDGLADSDALKALQEALELQSRCLHVQERTYEQSLEQERLATEQMGSDEMQMNTAEPDGKPEPATATEEEQWFSVVEPVTKDTLTDTVLAQLATLTTLCGLLSTSPESALEETLPRVQEYSTSALDKAVLFSKDERARWQEVALTKANFVSAFLEAAFRSGTIDAASYQKERNLVFGVEELQLGNPSAALIANGRSLLAFNSALADVQSDEPQTRSTMRWNVLTASISTLAAASQVQRIDQGELATTHLLRGDASLYLHCMQYPPTSHQAAIDNGPQLAKNAEVFYRNAGRLTADPDERDVAVLRSAVAAYLQAQMSGQADVGTVLAASSRGQQWATEQLEDMIAEGLVLQEVFA